MSDDKIKELEELLEDARQNVAFIKEKLAICENAMSSAREQLHRAQTEKENRLRELEVATVQFNAILKVWRIFDGSEQPRTPTDWREILYHTGRRFPTQFGYAELTDIAHALNMGVTSDSCRAAMREYVHRGLVDRIHDGVFAISVAGRQELLMPVESKNREQPANG